MGDVNRGNETIEWFIDIVKTVRSTKETRRLKGCKISEIKLEKGKCYFVTFF